MAVSVTARWLGCLSWTCSSRTCYAKRLRTSGADPLVTYYDVAKGERIELSAVTFANWVAKTANLLSWEVSIAPGDVVALPLAQTSPGHWMTAVWEVAIWQIGAYVDVSSEFAGAAVLVCGPDWQPYADAGADVLACSLHPFATGLGHSLPPTVTDLDLAVRAQPDSYTPMPGAPVSAGLDRRRATAYPGRACLRARLDRARAAAPDGPLDDRPGRILAALVGAGRWSPGRRRPRSACSDCRCRARGPVTAGSARRRRVVAVRPADARDAGLQAVVVDVSICGAC